MFQRIGLFLLLFCYSPQYLLAQEWEFGAFTGTSGYIGDLNPRNPFKFTDQANSFFLKYNYSRLSAYKIAITQAAIQANDANSSNASQKQRNLNFNSAITELALLYEFNFFECLLALLLPLLLDCMKFDTHLRLLTIHSVHFRSRMF